jgi:hypothetical protein
MESQMAMGNTYGKTDKFIKANGWTAWKTVLVYGGVLREIHILDNGKTERLMDMEFTHG